MKAIITTRPVYMMTLDKKIISALRKLSASHYDMQCKVAGRPGGFLFGWANCVEIGVDCTASFGQLDLTTKIAESAPQLLESSDIELVRQYVSFVTKVINATPLNLSIELGE